MIKIIKTPKTGLYVNESKSQSDKSNPKGYFMVEEITKTFSTEGWKSTTTKTMLFKGIVAELEQDIKDMNYQMTGCLYIEELVESDFDSRPDLKKRVLSKELREIPVLELDGEDAINYEKAIQSNLKLSGKDGIQLTHNGDRILRFTSYDPTGTKLDTLVKYNNFAELNAHQKEVSEREAELEGGETETVAPKTTKSTTK